MRRSVLKDETYRAHLNKYHVLYIDTSDFIGTAGSHRMLEAITQSVSLALHEQYPELKKATSLVDLLNYAVVASGRKCDTR